MRRLVITCAITLLCLGIQGIGWAQSIPSGSYQQSCKNIGVLDEVLSANCQDSDGKWEATQLRDYRNCGGDIMNDNGALRCGNTVNGAAVRYPGGYQQAGVPSGSYTQSCQEIRVHGDDLEARCQAVDGSWHKSKLDDFQKCGGDVANDNGNLRCVNGALAPGYAGGYRGPAGVVGIPYTQNCKDIKTHGDELEARCKNSHGDWQNTSLHDYRKCHGQIMNQDGALRCVAGFAGAGGVLNGPGGSYTQSCQNIRVEGDDLKADCASNSGETRSTHLDDFQKCKSDIVNDDGHLRCSK